MDDATQAILTRIFIGLKVNREIADQLAALAAALKDTPARRVAAPDIHLTLVPPWQERSIDQAIGKLWQVAAKFMPFTLKLQHLGYGRNLGDRPRFGSIAFRRMRSQLCKRLSCRHSGRKTAGHFDRI